MQRKGDGSVDFLAALRLPPGAAIAVYAGELPPGFILPPAIRRADTVVIGVTYYGEPLMLFSCPRDAINGLEATIQPVLDDALRKHLLGHGTTDQAQDKLVRQVYPIKE